MSEQKQLQVRSAGMAVMPANIKERLALANQLAESNLVPTCYQSAPENIVAAIQMGQELGIPPMVMLSNSFPVKNKIGIMTDLMVALVKRHPAYGGMDVEGGDKYCKVTIRRLLPNGMLDTHSNTFTIEEARKAGLIKPDGAWEKYPARMLKHRATAFSARDAFPDVLAGVYTTEELSSMPDSNVELKDVSPEPEKTEPGFVDDNPDVPVVVVGTVVEEEAVEPRLAELVELAKIAKYSSKAVMEIKQRWRGLKGLKRGQDALYKAMMQELQPKADAVRKAQDKKNGAK